ncbi:MAG: NAD-dependent epimerase/dehydratase family protein [Labilithrix sp.]|nr:NAD-dependent epimerase/dehydratase family protein [Labilithrix sp.]MCW5811426.1 NAD-dependent epimerase/dehydratase family protein [Labilithrix sp.]
MDAADVMVLGAGYVGGVVARRARARGLRVVATVRREERAEGLRRDEVGIVVAEVLRGEDVAAFVGERTLVVVAFPPDGESDARVAAGVARARAIAYVSSTGVYGARRGTIDDATPVEAPAGPRAARVLAAEEVWRGMGATVLRCPAIYGPERGLHRRIVRGEHRIAGDGSAFTSRIHVDDLAALLLAIRDADARVVRGATFVVGDAAPATQREIAEWVAREYDVPYPPHVPAEEVHETLRADRRVDGSRALAVLGVTLAYPHYRDGMKRTLDRAPP